jgi:membrane associated rhomboid family serine protease
MIPIHDNIPTKRTPYLTWSIIALNVYVFYLQLRTPNTEALEKFIYHWSLIPRQFFGNFSQEWYTAFTAAFLHGGWLHLISNMLFLHIFGNNVEDRMGKVRFFIFYFLTAFLANYLQAYLFQKSVIPLLGASGAVAGVLGAYFFYYPYAKISTVFIFIIFIRTVEIPAFIFLGLWFVMQAFQGTTSLANPNAAKC